jgi:hypothetical protein
MMMNQPLNLLQHWMNVVLTERGSLSEKLAAATERHGLSIEEVIIEKRGLSAHKRLSIYTNGYVLRLIECMRADFPALRNFVGDSVFDAFAKAFIISEPPTAQSLFDLSARFPQFLEDTKPVENSLQGEFKFLLDLPPELARLERARTEVMRARGIENDSGRKEPLSPFAIFSEDVTLQATHCLRLLKLKFPLVDFLKQSDSGGRPLPPTPRLSFLAIGRSNYQINIEEVTAWQFAFLKACEHPGSLYLAAQRAALESGCESATVLAELLVWLPLAIELGYLRQLY